MGGKRDPRASGDGKATGPKGIPDEAVIAALMATGGIYTHAAKKLGVRPDSLRERVGNSTLLLEALKEAKYMNLDLAEGVIVKKIAGGDVGAAMWYLDRQGRDRGYGKQVEHKGTGEGGAIVHDATVTHKFDPEVYENVRRRFIDDGDDE